MNINFSNPENVLRLIFIILSPQLIISSMEVVYTRTMYKEGYLLSWSYIKKSKKIFRLNRLTEKMFDLIFHYPNSIFLIAVKLLLTIITIFFALRNESYGVEIIILTVLTILGNLRDTYSNNGSDQLTSIILISLSLAALRPDSLLVQYAAIFFIAFQAVLSYFTSGIYKFINQGWRNGDSLRAILSTEIFGDEHIKKVMDNMPNSYAIGSFLIIFGEIFLAMSFMMPPPICLFILSTGILFHVSVAAVMGLNTFLWTFASAYPAIYFISLHYFNY